MIVGAGVSGLAIAKKLNDIGLKNYTILEQGSGVGGVWYWNKVKTNKKVVRCACKAMLVVSILELLVM